MHPPRIARHAASALAVASLGWASPAAAVVLYATVTVTTDTPDTTPGDGFCIDAAGECSLRAAIDEANALPEGSFVRVSSGVVDPVVLDGPLVVGTAVQVEGLAIVGGCGGAVFELEGAPYGLELFGVDLENGCADGEASAIEARDGGYVLLDTCSVTGFERTDRAAVDVLGGDVVLYDSVLQRNRHLADGNGYGGAVAVWWGSLDVTGSIFVENEAAAGGAVAALGSPTTVQLGTRFEMNIATLGSGGGLFFQSLEANPLAVSDTYFLGNDAPDSVGGAAEVDARDTTATFDRVAFYGNAALNCGALWLWSEAASMTSSSLLHNFADNLGAALCVSGSMDLINSTVFQNLSGLGGGAFESSLDGVIRAGNSLIALNYSTPFETDCTGEVESLGHNLVSRVGFWGEDPICDGFDFFLGDRVGSVGHSIALHLGGVGVWGDSPFGLPTLKIGWPSPAVEGGDPALCPGYDQNLHPPVDADRDGSPVCDVGAHEWGVR